MTRRGYASIVEYLLVAVAVLGAVLALVRSGAIGWKTLQVSVTEINEVEAIRWDSSH